MKNGDSIDQVPEGATLQDLVDVYMRLRDPARYQAVVAPLVAKCEAEFHDKFEAIEAADAARRRKLTEAIRLRFGAEPYEALGWTIEEAVDAAKTASARRRGGQLLRRHHIPAIEPALRAFLLAEREGDAFSAAIRRARRALVDAEVKHPPTDGTLREWLRYLIAFGVSSIPPPRMEKP